MAEEPALAEPIIEPAIESMAEQVFEPGAPHLERAPAPASAEADFGDPLCTRWTALMRQLVERQALVGITRELGLQAQCVGFDAAAGTIRLRVERETLRQGEHPKKLQAALAELLGREWTLEFEAGAVSDTPHKRELAARAQRQREAEATIEADPLVQRMRQQFRSARIVPGSVQPR
jgi:DNA polymerase-3 subunit gamma/tau